MDILAYLDNCKVVSTVQQTDDEREWKAVRNKGIGGSDVGIICGVNNYTSIRQLYLQKTGQLEEDERSVFTDSVERMHFGHILEPVVADEYVRRTETKVTISPATVCHKDYRWARANIDRFIVDENGKPIGILECKTAGSNMLSAWETADIPRSYYYQVQWYLFVTGLKMAAIACLVGGNKFFYYDIPRDEDVIKEIFAAADKFWNYNVLNLVTPEYNGTDADEEMVNEENAEVIKGSEIVLEDDVDNELAQALFNIKGQLKELEKAEKELKNRIKDKMKENEVALTADFIIKWSLVNQSRVDSKMLKEDYPDVYEACLKQSSYRKMTIKGGA